MVPALHHWLHDEALSDAVCTLNGALTLRELGDSD